jgi:hypothetical protein
VVVPVALAAGRSWGYAGGGGLGGGFRVVADADAVAGVELTTSTVGGL